MSEKLTNPFRNEPSNLDPNEGDFLEKFAGVSKEDLVQSGIVSGTVENPELAPIENPEAVPGFMSAEEKEKYENELVPIGEVMIKRSEKEKLEELVRYVNERIEEVDQSQNDEKFLHTDDVLYIEDGIAPNNTWYYVNKKGEVVYIDLSCQPVGSIAIFEKFSYLETLRLVQTDIDSVKNIKMPRLQSLSLSSCNISMVDPTCFSDKLRFLDVGNTILAEDYQRVVELQDALPYCDIKYSAY